MEIDELRRILYSELDALEDQFDESDDGKSVESAAPSRQDMTDDVADGDGAAWNDLMDSLKTVNERFQVVEESLQYAVKGDVRDHSPVPHETSNIVSGANSFLPMQYPTNNMELTQSLTQDLSSRQVLQELMDRIIDSIELSAPVFRQTALMGSVFNPPQATVDISSLPELIIDEVGENEGSIGMISPEEPSFIAPSTEGRSGDNGYSERVHLELAHQELIEAEEVLRIQSEDAARYAEEKKRQLFHKKKLREAELLEIATTKGSLNLQTLWRGYAARSKLKPVIEQARASRRNDEEKRRVQFFEEEERCRRVAQEEAAALQRLREAEEQEQLVCERREEEERQERQAQRQTQLQLERDRELLLMEQCKWQEEEHRCREKAERNAMAAMEKLSRLTCAWKPIRQPDVEYDFDYESDTESTCTDQSPSQAAVALHRDHSNSTESIRREVEASAPGWANAPRINEEEVRTTNERVESMLSYWQDLVLTSAKTASTTHDGLCRLRAAAVQQLSPCHQVADAHMHNATSVSPQPPGALVVPTDALMQALNCYKSYETRTSVCKRLLAFQRLADSSPSASPTRDRLKGRRNDAKPPTTTTARQPLSNDEKDRLCSFGLRCPEEVAPEVYRDISLCVESITDCSFLRAFSATLRIVQLNVNKLRNLRGLEDMTVLEELSATDNGISDAAALSALTSLRTLRLGDNHLTAEAVTIALAGLPQLHTLSLNTNKLTSLPVLTGCDGLQRLEVYHNSIASISVESLRALKSLTHLDMGRNKLESIAGDSLSQCPLLQTLVLSQNMLTHPPAPLYLPNLRTLWLSSNRMASMEDWEPRLGPNGTLSWPIFLPVLEKLHLQDNTLATIPATALCNMPLLTHLDASFNAIVSTENLRGLKHLPLLSVLNLNDNPVYSSAASETRAGELNRLHAFLVRECLSLRVLSGTSLQRSVHVSTQKLQARDDGPCAAPLTTPLVVSKWCAENVWELTGLGSIGSVVRPAFAGADAVSEPSSSDTQHSVASNYLQDTLVEFRSGQPAEDGYRLRWPRYCHIQSLHYQLQVRALHESQAGSKSSIISNTGSCGDCVVLYNASQASRAFVQLLQGLCASCNVLRAREKNGTAAFKRAEGAPNTCAQSAVTEDLPRVGWEQLCTQQLLQHTQVVLNWVSGGATASSVKTRLISMRATDTDVRSPVVLRLASFEDLLREEEGGDRGSVGGDVPPTPSDVPRMTATYASEPSSSHSRESTTQVRMDGSRLSKVQAAWRGYRLRKQVKGILASSRYCDDELDDLLRGGSGYDDNGEPQMDALVALGIGLDSYDDLLNPTALRGDWRQMAHGDGITDEEEGDVEGDVGTASFVYGDHRRRGSFIRSRGPDEVALDRASLYSDFDRSGPSNHAGGVVPWPPPASRPSTSFTETSSISAASSRAHTEPDDGMSLRSHSAHQGDGTGVGIAELFGDRIAGQSAAFTPVKSPRSRAEALSDEWGISDPKVLQAMQKRNKRMKSFAAAKESREREKDPEVRYQRFVKNSFKTTTGVPPPAGGGAAAGAGSGAPGGRGNAGYHMGTGRGRGGRFGGGPRKTVPMPAWALGSTDNEEL